MDVRKAVVRFVTLGFALGLFLGSSAVAQLNQGIHTQHRETNASRQARIKRTIEETYAHRWEIYGGGGYLRFRSGSSLKRNNEVSWAAGANYFLNPKLFIVGAAQGSFGSANIGTNIYDLKNPQINEYFFTGGAGYRFYKTERVAVSAQATGGTAWGIFSGANKGFTGADVGIWNDGIRPAITGSVNVDYNFYPDLAFRVSPTYVATMFQNAAGYPSSSFQSNVGFNAGLVYRFGR